MVYGLMNRNLVSFDAIYIVAVTCESLQVFCTVNIRDDGFPC